MSNTKPGRPSPGKWCYLVGRPERQRGVELSGFVGGRRFRVWEAAVFGASHVERALAFRLVAGQPVVRRFAKGSVSSLVVSARARLTTPVRVLSGLARQPSRWRLSSCSWWIRRQTGSPLEAGHAGNG